MTTVHGIVIHGRYRYAAFYRLTDLPLPTTPRHLQEWRRLPLRSRRGQDMGQDSAHGTCRQAGAVTRPRLWASANGRRNWRGARSEDPETPPSRLAGPGEATRPRVNRHEWTCWAAECRSRTYCVPSWPCVHSFFKVTCLFSPKASQELRAVSWRIAPKLDASYTACSLLERWPGEHVGRRPEHRHDTEGSETRDLSRARLGRPPAAPAHVFARGLEEEKREHEEIERRDVDDAVGVEELAWLG